MRKVVAIAALALLGAGCAGRTQVAGPADLPAQGREEVPPGMKGEVADSVPTTPTPPIERSDLEPLPLPAGVSADDFDIALQYNRRVAYWLDYFQKYRGTFATWLDRMSRYEPYIRRELTTAGLPGDLIYLALIESGFTPNATSSAKAVGIWQFMAGTARLEGMEVSTYIDERRDPIRATQAAVHHLRSLYKELGSWYLVAAAYNSGSGRVSRTLDSVTDGARGADSLFWTIEPLLPSETRDYVPKFLAASMLAKYPDRFGIDPGELPGPDDFDVVRIRRATDIAAIARAAHSPEDVVRRLNPQFYRGVTPPGRTVEVRVPAGHAEHLLARLDAMPRRERVHDLRFTLDASESPQSLADRYGISLAALRKANHLKKKTKLLAAGRELVIPLGPVSAPMLASAEAPRERRAWADDDVTASRRSDEADSSARRRLAAADDGDDGSAAPAAHRRAALPERVSSERSRQKPAAAGNAGREGELRTADLSPDEKRRPAEHAQPAERSGSRETYRVRHGDTLSRIADKYGLTVAELRELNGLSRKDVIRSGQELRVSRRRVVVYRVREGDTLWRIAQKHGVSVDNLRDWNGLAAGSVLRPGEEMEVHLQK